MPFYAPRPDRDQRRATGEALPAKSTGKGLETTLPTALDLLRVGIGSETSEIAPRLVSGELAFLNAGELVRREVNVSTPTESYREEHVFLAIGAGDKVVDVTGVLSGEVPFAQFAALNPIFAETAPSSTTGQETGQTTQNTTTAQQTAQGGTLESGTEVVEQDFNFEDAFRESFDAGEDEDFRDVIVGGLLDAFDDSGGGSSEPLFDF